LINVKLKITFIFKVKFWISDRAQVVLNVTIYISRNVNSLCVGKFSRNVITHSFVDSGLGVENGYHE